MRKSILPPRAKYIISSPTDAFPDLDVSLDVASWEDLDVVLERSMTSGVLSDISFPIKIALKGRELLKSLFEQYQFHAEAVFSIYTRAWKIAGLSEDQMYTHVTSLRLDFTTYSEDDHYVEISGASADLIEYIRSFGKNKYDIPVAEVAEATKWEYQRMKMLNQGPFIPVPGIKTISNPVGSAYISLPLYTGTVEMVPNTAEHDIRDQQFAQADSARIGNYYFFKAAGDVNISIKAKFTLEINDPSIGTTHYIAILKNNATTGASNIIVWMREVEIETEYTYETIDEIMSVSDLVEGDTLTLCTWKITVGNYRIGFTEENKIFSLSYYESAPVFSGDEAIPVIDPQTLMNTFLERMAPGKFTCEIEWQGEPALIKLVTGESLRGYPAIEPTETNDKVAYMHGSPNDLVDFMRVLGYEWEVDGTVIRFKRRDEFFRRDVTAVRLTEKEVSEFKIIANQDHAYTKVVIGCEKQDYDSVNGPFEANFIHEYLTGHRDLNDRVLDLTSPYRTDPIGIELTTWERANLLTDKKADSDIFAVILQRDGDRYIEYTDVYTENPESPDLKMFNAYFNPYYLMKRNESLIGIIAREARFTSNEGSKNAVIRTGAETVNPRQNITITKKLHEPVMYDFEVGFKRFLPTSDVWNGLVYIPHRGKMYRGFISDISKNHGQEKQEAWGLWAVMD